ncbi:hypothetical protein D3C86_1865430 [compost metagenome]
MGLAVAVGLDLAVGGEDRGERSLSDHGALEPELGLGARWQADHVLLVMVCFFLGFSVRSAGLGV